MSSGKSFSEWFSTYQAEQQEGDDEGDVEAPAQQSTRPWYKRVFGGDSQPPPPPPVEQQSLLPSFFRGGAGRTDTSPIPSLSRTDRFKGFVIMIMLSVLFFGLSFFVGLPMVLLSPAKFAISFTLGSLCFMTAFALLDGPWQHIKRMFTKERLLFTSWYLLSMVLTLYCALILKNYLAIIISACFQLAALAWYGASYIPGGATGLKFITRMFLLTLKSLVKPCFRSWS